MKGAFNILAVTFFALATHIGLAQKFPIRITPVIAPPYTPFLTDYLDAGSDKLTLQIVLNDITVPEYRCKLRLSIEGVNISITTNPIFIPLPIVLSGGVPEILYGSDISDYFKNSNLIFKGISQQEFEKKGNQLPEGIYRFSVEVLDYNRGTVVSNKGNATAWMLLNDPPIINVPANNSKLKPLSPQNIVFQWTPRHRGSPNAAFTTEYDVKLVEIWPVGRNPYDAINTSLPIFETTTENTMVVYGPAETPLVPGREYALQIRARDTGGKDLFKNNGYSEVFRFVYGDECPMPSGIQADEIGTERARIRWQGNALNSGYVLRYREKKDGTQWFGENTDKTFVNTTGMKPGATYEYQLCGECETFRSEYSKEQTFTTLAENPHAFVCGNPNALIPIDGSGPLPALMSNDFIKAGGFEVVVTHATGSNGKFSGEGLATVPWFNNGKVRVTFANISVNKSYQLTSGFINSRWNKDSKLLLTDENKLTENNNPSSKHKSDVQTFEADTTVLIKNTMIASVFQNPDGNIVVQTTDGSSITLAKGKSYALADEVGNGYLIDKEGNVTKTTAEKVIAAGQSPTGSSPIAVDPLKEMIIISILEQFEEEVAAWLRVHGKGGEDDDDILLAIALPACFPQNENILEHIHEQTIPYFKEHPIELLEKIESNQSDKQGFERILELFKGATKIDWNKVSEEDKELAREVTCRATVEADAEMLKTELVKGMNTSIESDCLAKAWERGKDVYGKYDFNIALYAGFIRYLLCETEEKNCGKESAASAFPCGLSNGFLLEVDWVALLEAAEDISNLKPEEILQCLVEAIPFGGKREDNPDFNDVLFHCITGAEIGDLVDGVKEFIAANWDEPYYQGQATAFVVMLFSPLKGKIIEKIRNLPNYAGKIGKLETLAKAKNADELVVLAKGVAKGGNNLIDALFGSIRSTYDDLIKAGLKSEIKANSILLKNAAGETTAIISNDKLTPIKWASSYRTPNAIRTQTSEGYIILKDGDNIKLDLGFKEGRKLEAKEVNDYLVQGQEKDLDGQPYWAGTPVEEVLLGRKGEVIYFVENYNGGVANPGQYATKDPITTIKELREKLAVKEAWKETAMMPTLRTYRVKTDLRARSGIIGRQSDNGLELPGGGRQYEVIDYLGGNWTMYLEEVGPKNGIKLK